MSRALLLCLLLLHTFGCSSSSADKEAVTTLAMKRLQALNNRDMTVYRSLISPDYDDKGKDCKAVTEQLEVSITSFDRINYRSDGLQVKVSGTRATISGNYELKVSGKGKNLSLAGTENISLKKQGGEWKIVGGL